MQGDAEHQIFTFLSSHLASEESTIYTGPDNGAHQPIFFTRPEQLRTKFFQLKKAVSIVRTTASLYTGPHRTAEAAERVWCIACDFDFDRGEWENVPRRTQEATLYETCKLAPPTFATQTRNGFHLFWVLEEPESVFAYPYVSALLKDMLKADPHSVVPVHCLNFHSRGRKPAHLVDTMLFPELGTDLPLIGRDFKLYTTQSLLKQLKQNNVSEAVMKLYQMSQQSYQRDKLTGVLSLLQSPSGDNFDPIARKMKIDALLERYDIAQVLQSAGYQAYNRGRNKIITICPYHYDRHPSAFVNIDPDSEFYGMFNCSSCGTKKSLQKLLTDIGLDI